MNDFATFRYNKPCDSPRKNPAVWADGYKQDNSVYSTVVSVYAIAGKTYFDFLCFYRFIWRKS